MKMKYTYLIAVLFSTVAMSSCSGSDDVTNASQEGLVPVTVQLPGSYNTVSRATKPDFASTNIYYLDQHSTIWLYANDGTTTTRKGYIVKTSTGGIKALYPCVDKTNSDGSVDIDTTNVGTTPLYLAPGKTYTIRSISPAKTIADPSNTNVNKFKIKNGEFVVATNDYWNETKYTTLTLSTTSSKDQVIVLNPMMQVGSRMTFTIKKTDRISSLSVIQSGLELDGVGQDMDASEYYTLGDTIVAKVGNPYNRMFIKPNQFALNSDGNLYSEIGILPVDCRSTTIYMVLNLMVNAVPMQYTFAVKKRLFRAGYSYDYVVTLDVKDNITVANWQENSWSYDANPD